MSTTLVLLMIPGVGYDQSDAFHSAVLKISQLVLLRSRTKKVRFVPDLVVRHGHGRGLIRVVLLGLLLDLFARSRQIHRSSGQLWIHERPSSVKCWQQSHSRSPVCRIPGHVCGNHVGQSWCGRFKSQALTMSIELLSPLVQLPNAVVCSLALSSCSSGRRSSITQLLVGTGTRLAGQIGWAVLTLQVVLLYISLQEQLLWHTLSFWVHVEVTVRRKSTTVLTTSLTSSLEPCFSGLAGLGEPIVSLVPTEYMLITRPGSTPVAL